MLRKWLGALLCVSAGAAITGCGSGDPFPKRYPVSGTVTVDGKPAPRATVVFIPLDAPEGKAYRGATVAEDSGAYTLTTHHMNDGAAAGEYKVLITWPRYIKNGFGDTVPGPDQLNGKYGDEKTTPLKATVVAGDNQIPFDLKSSKE